MAYKQTRVFINEVNEDLPPNIPIILDDQSLAYQLGIDNRSLWQIFAATNQDPNKIYREFKIPKPNKPGEFRTVVDVTRDFPKRDNAYKVLAALHGFLFSDYAWGDHVDAFVPKKSRKESGEKHANSGVILALDIKNFFPSITQRMVIQALCDRFKMNFFVAGLIARVCTFMKRLPQGSPISPALSNLVGDHRFDHVILDSIEAEQSGWRYSRYCDDLILSHPDDLEDVGVWKTLNMVNQAVIDAGFKPNPSKTRVYGKRKGRRCKHVWLGMVINERANVDNDAYRRLRQLLYIASATGFKKQAERYKVDTVKHVANVRGVLSQMKGLVADNRYEKLSEWFYLALARDGLEEITDAISDEMK